MTFSHVYRLALGFSTFVLAGGLEAQARHEFTAVHMGVQVRIALYAPTDDMAREAARAAFRASRSWMTR